MARRQQRVQVQDLRDAPSLRPAAEPVRGYFPEQPKNLPDSDLTQVARAVADVNPEIMRGLEARQQVTSQEDIAEAQRKYRETKMPLKEAVKSGAIREGQSPAFRRAWKQSHLRVKGKEFGAFLREQYANSPVSQSADPAAAAEFAQEQYQAWIENQADVQSADDIDMAEVFLPEVDQSINQLTQQHEQRAFERVEREARENLGAEIALSTDETLSADPGAIMEAAPGATDLTEARYSIIADAVQQRVDDMIESGMNGSDANRVAIDSLSAYEDPELIRGVLDKINTGSGPLSRTQSAREAINRVEDKAVQREIRDYRFRNQLESDRKERNRKQVVSGYVNEVMGALADASPSERVSLLQDFDPVEYATDNGVTDADTLEALMSVESNISRSSTGVEEDPEVVRGLYDRISSDPGSVSKEEIIGGIGEDYSFSRARQLIGDLDSVTDEQGEYKEHPWLESNIYKELERTLGNTLKDIVDMGGVPAQNAASGTVDFQIGVRNWLEANPEATQSEFREAIRKEWDSIISVYREIGGLTEAGETVPAQRTPTGVENESPADETSYDDRVAEYRRIESQYEEGEISLDEFLEQTEGLYEAIQNDTEGGE